MSVDSVYGIKASPRSIVRTKKKITGTIGTRIQEPNSESVDYFFSRRFTRIREYSPEFAWNFNETSSNYNSNKYAYSASSSSPAEPSLTPWSH